MQGDTDHNQKILCCSCSFSHNLASYMYDRTINVVNEASKKVFFFSFINHKLMSAYFPFHNSLQRVIGFLEQLLTIVEWCLHSVTLVSCFSPVRWEVMNPLWAWPAYAPYTFALHWQCEFSTTLFVLLRHDQTAAVGYFHLTLQHRLLWIAVNVVVFIWTIFFIYYLRQTYS